MTAHTKVDGQAAFWLFFLSEKNKVFKEKKLFSFDYSLWALRKIKKHEKQKHKTIFIFFTFLYWHCSCQVLNKK